MKSFNGFYHLYTNIKKLEIKIFFDDEKTESQLKQLFIKYNLKELKPINNIAFNEKQLKIVFDESKNINDFIQELKQLKIIEIKHTNTWKYENIQTF